jgi:tetratricopeptide (TPR) repeat protein
MDIAEQISVLQAAHGHPAKLALAVVDLAYPSASNTERESLRNALEAAAIPHWCDVATLAALCQVTRPESEALLARLITLSVVEAFRARGDNSVNVHEASRLAIRKWISVEQPEKFRELSARAAARFADDPTPSGRIEWIYHLLSADPEGGATALQKLDREWSNQARPEDRYAFAAALQELEKGKLLTGRARLWALLSVAGTQASRGDRSVPAASAAEALELARELQDKRAEGDAQWLVGDVLMVEGKTAEAQKAYETNLKISRELAERNPDNAGWQRELANALFMAARVEDARGKRETAEQNRWEGVAILRRLVAQDPANSVWRLDLGRALVEIGDMLQASQRFGDAKDAFDETLRIRTQIWEKDPTNAFFQQDLALAHSRLGDFWLAQGEKTKAHDAYTKALGIVKLLVAQDVTHDEWQKVLAVSENRLGNVLMDQEKYPEAQNEFEKSLEISRNLVAKNPANLEWQRELGAGLIQLGYVLRAQEKQEEAQRIFEEALQVYRSLNRRDSERVEWQRELASTCVYAARGLTEKDRARALALYDEAIQIDQALIDAGTDPDATAHRDIIANERAQLEGLKPNGTAP